MWFNFLVWCWCEGSCQSRWNDASSGHSICNVKACLRGQVVARKSWQLRSCFGVIRQHESVSGSDSLWLFAFFALLWYGRRALVQILWWPLCSTIYSLLCSFFQQRLAATLLYYYCSLIIQLSGLVLGLTSVLVLCPPCPLLMSLSVTSHVSECDQSIDVVILMLSLSVFFSVFSFLCYSFNMTKSIFC